MFSISTSLQPECPPPQKSSSSQRICIHNSCLPLHVTYGRYSTMHSLCWSQVFSDVRYWPDSFLHWAFACVCTVHVRVCLQISAGTADALKVGGWGVGGALHTAKSTNKGFSRQKEGKTLPSLKLFCVTLGYSLQHESTVLIFCLYY